MDKAAPPKKGNRRHHINGDESDDRPENLYYCKSVKEHMQIHALARKMHKEKGWNLESTTRWWMANHGTPKIVVVSDEEYEKSKKLGER